jgi:hypothetical protein
MDELFALTTVGKGGGGKRGGVMEIECCCVTAARGSMGVGWDHVSSAVLDSIILREAEPPVVSLPDF